MFRPFPPCFVARETDASEELLWTFSPFHSRLGSANGKLWQEAKEQEDKEAGVFLPLFLSALEPLLK